MRKRVKVSAMGVLVSAAVALIGGIMAASTAFAVPPAPTNIVIDSNVDVTDNFINQNEVTAVKVTGEMDPTSDQVRVRIVNSASCSSGATQQVPTSGIDAPATFTGPNTWEITFDVSSFDEGGTLCAQARASNDGMAFGPGKIFGPRGNSTNLPVKDTIVNAGTVVIIDPLDDGFLNAAEASGGTVSADFTAASGAPALANDATQAQTWWGLVGSAVPYTGNCGKFPALFGPPATGNQGLSVACANDIPEGDTFSLNAQWKDDQGNISSIAFADAPLSRPLVKDTLAPLAPVVNLVTDPITASNVTNVRVEVNAELDSMIDLDLSSGATLSQLKLSTDPNPILFFFNATTLTDCGASKVTTPPDPLLPKCVSATATATDEAGNVSAPGVDVGYKDATVPLPPVLNIDPSFINTDINTLVEVETTGETFNTISLRLSDQDPGTSDITVTSNSDNLGYVAQFIDTAPLTDGLITATATLTDGVGNVSLPGTTTATKGSTTPSVQITSPAQNSLNTEFVRIAGTATPLSQVTVFNAANNEPIVTNIPVDSTGAWSATHRFITSGTKTIYARRIGDTSLGSAVRIFDVDAIRPGAAISTLDGALFTPGSPVIINGTATDDFSGVAAVRVDVYDARNTRPEININNPGASQIRYGLPVVTDVPATCAGCSTFQKQVTWSYDLTGQLARGVYVFEATSIDKAGNRVAQAPKIHFVVL